MNHEKSLTLEAIEKSKSILAAAIHGGIINVSEDEMDWALDIQQRADYIISTLKYNNNSELS